jgi:drug/metabolite transporter (DMT)-like permease
LAAARMSIFNLILILICVFGIACGQILFKLASGFFPKSLAFNELLSFALNRYFLSALVIYGLATILWIYALKLVPLNVAYPSLKIRETER